MLRFWFPRLCIIAFVVLSLTNIVAAQSLSEPPARTTYTDNGAVKERWSTDANGAKNGRYIKYSRTGKVIESSTFQHGVLSGPASYVDSSGPFPSKYEGNYVGGKKAGQWLEYKFQDKLVTGKLEYNAQGVMFRRTTYIDYAQNKPKDTYTYDEYGMLNGPAKEYSNGNVSTYASGSYANSRRVGVWENSMLDKNDNLVYARGAKVEYEAGTAVSVTDNTGKVRSLKDEARANQALLAKNEADRQAAAAAEAAAAPKRYDAINGASDIHFMRDSYLLTDKGELALSSVARQINERSSSTQKVNTVYLSVHCANIELPDRDTPKKDSLKQKVFTLSLNRAFVIKQRLEELIEDKQTKFEWYGCGSTFATHRSTNSEEYDSKVVMSFNERIGNEQAAYLKLVTKFGLNATDHIIASDIMRSNILSSINEMFDNEYKRAELVGVVNGMYKRTDSYFLIPRELWLPTIYSTKFGENSPMEFRSEVERRFLTLSKKYGVMSGTKGNGLPPSVLFEKELEQYVAQSGN